MKKRSNKKPVKRYFTINLFLALFIGIIIFFFSRDILASITATVLTFILPQIFIFSREKLKESNEIRKMENAFPDFLQLMASNLRAGMTIDRALLLSSRKEFEPLDKKILSLGKDILIGTEINKALAKMASEIKSERIDKTISLIISGIRSGGNLAILLEQTATSMRERAFVEKRAASNVLMYVIFIFFAISVGAPVLFGLSSVLVQVLTEILSTIPSVEASSNIPFTLTSINVSVTFIIYFSFIFLIVIDVLGSLVLGLVSKGEEKQGIKYIIPLILISIVIFFSTRLILLSYFRGGILS